MSLISYITKIHFADNVLEDAIEAEFDILGMTRPLIVSDHDATRAAVLGRLEAAIPRGLPARIYALPSSVPTEAACDAAAALYRDWEADGIVAFGAAGAHNVAKATALRVSHEGPLARYAGVAGGPRIAPVLPPLIIVPTMAGACSDAVGLASIVMSGGGLSTFASPCLTPRVVICDPTLTLDLSAEQTAGGGMDALTHCVETYIASAYNPPADGIARDGLRRAAANLRKAVDNSADLRARRELMAAALNGTLAQQKGLGGVHAMSHGLLGAVDGGIDHGAANAVLLPLVLEFNAPAVSARYDVIRYEMGLSRSADIAEAMVRLRERVALPASLGALGVRRNELGRAADYATRDHANRTNPRHAGSADYRAMLEAAF